MHPKITLDHLARQAIVYVRQSTLRQVLENTESAERQYALADKAAEYGWPAAQIIVIDEDQGHSAASADGRTGFQQLVSALGLGQVGLVLALEISRFARSQSDWYRVLELAAMFHTLIADEDGLYDPQDHNDRLLLGLKGTLSEAELWSIRSRLQGGRWNKARKGELACGLPVGYIRETDGRVVLDPDQQVQATVRTIFEQFRLLGSATAVLRYFREHRLPMPRGVLGVTGPGHVVWKPPTYEAIYLILTSPTYAGAYAYGRRQSQAAAKAASATVRRRLPQEEWAVLIQDVYPAYIPWAAYLDNRARLAANRSQFQPGPGAARQGEALLTGLVLCAQCGRHLGAVYNPDPWYACGRAKLRYGEPRCQSCKAQPVDRLVSELFLQAVQPAQLEAALQAMEQLDQERHTLEGLWQQQLERARYEAERAQRQYDRVEPENRLVARELETRWNAALAEVRRLEPAYRQARQQLAPLTAEDRTLIRQLLTDLPRVWHAETTTAAERKRLLRCLIRDVTVDGLSQPGQIVVHVRWQTAAVTTMLVRRPRASDHAETDGVILERMRVLAADHDDGQIAELLNAEHFQTRQGKEWSYRRVHAVRLRHHIPSGCPIVPLGDDAPRGDGLVSVRMAARLLGVSPSAIQLWTRRGVLQTHQLPGNNPIWLRVDAADVQRLTATQPRPGYQRLQQVARTLSLTEAALWDDVKSGRRTIRRMQRGQRWEWQVAVSPAEMSPASP